MAKRTIQFYTEKEIEIIKEVASKGGKHLDNIKYLSKVLKRPESGIAVKYGNVRKSLGINRRKYRTDEEKKNVKFIEFPNDITLEFKPERVLLADKKLIIYFK